MCDDDAPGADDDLPLPTDNPVIPCADDVALQHRANCLQWALDIWRRGNKRAEDNDMTGAIALAKQFAISSSEERRHDPRYLCNDCWHSWRCAY